MKMNSSVKNSSHHFSQQQQLYVLRDSQLKCIYSMNETSQPQDGLYCPQTWDGAFCWPYAAAGTLVVKPCPDYVHGFNPNATASKYCSENGTWWVHPDLKQTWTNYSLCGNIQPSQDEGNVFVVHIPVIKAISQTGYSVSLTLLLIACLLLGSVRRLRCPRNNLHLQLFASFILRASVSLFRDLAYGNSLDEGSTLCKALTCFWQYCLMANYCWILMEGLYLHNLVFLSMFTDTAGILKYGILGWGLPLFSIIPWIIVKATLEDTLCWTVNENQSFFWIIRGPITASIVLNLIFFINITRVLFLKMFSSQAIQSRRYRYRKWFKSTLVLVPLFGVHYALLLAVSFAANLSEALEITWLYIDQTFSSFQGSFVALLYCFLNGEVQSEVRKMLERFREKEGGHNPQNSLLTQSLTYISKARSSVQSLHNLPITERKDNWKNGDMSLVPQGTPNIAEKEDWGQSVGRQQHAESLL
ncbi:parathyroid hormone/parathyroid hormone-related peptide receptor-like isoform X1 [Argiope bruennichi]|uniref:parathyroid hormone/parathyroid hormone-related peptide receptor-like isoform X1 n=1 Tax=Argiope bruennichi TaxID=94029 RepID=UPI0024954421|nr:parathyroid hormone/parathyroid hormone-related peptide receptor-like isoform X1 [Argiope bruennichi]